MSYQMNQHQAYMNIQVQTASPGELTLMLYNGCLKFMKQALDAINNKDFISKNANIKRSIDIVDELLITLNPKYEISNNLSALYVFIKEKLIEANLRLDVNSLSVSIELITELRDTWVVALKTVKKANVVNK